MGFRSLILDFSSGTCRTRFLAFCEKSAFLYDFVGKCTSNILGTTEVADRQISKNQFYSLLDFSKQMIFIQQSLKSDVNSLRSRLRKKNSTFFTCGWLSLLCTLHVLYKAFCESKNRLKMIFFESRSFRLRVLGGRFNVRNRLV